MKDRFGIGFWLALAVTAFAGLVLPAVSSAGWSPVATTPGFSGERPNDLTRLDTPDGGKLLYWHRDVGGDDTLQAMWVASDGTPGSIFDVLDLSAGNSRDLSAVIDGDGEVTFAWIDDGIVDDMVRSLSVPLDGAPGPVVDITPFASPSDLQHLSIAVTTDGTVGYTWQTLDAPIHRVEAVTVPDEGPVGTIRTYTDAPYDSSDPGIAATNGNQFRLAWIPFDTDTGFWNIATISIQNDGTPIDLEPTYLFPWTEPLTGIVNDVCQQLRDPVTNDLLFADSGATGDPRELQVGSNSAGQVFFAWIRDTVEATRECDGTPIVIEGEQAAVETGGFGSFGETVPLARVTPLNVDISNLTIQAPSNRRATLTWLADDDGTFTTQLFRFSDDGIWPVADGPDFVDPSVTVAANNAMGVGWTDEGALPDDAVAKAMFITRTGVLKSVVLPGLNDLKSSSELIADPGTGGLFSVLFYGLSMADVGSFYTSDFTDPGVSISPAGLNFGDLNVNSTSTVRRVFVSNPGSTANEVTAISLSGPDAAAFQIVSPASCLVELAPGASCGVQVSFKPGSAGNRLASLDIQTEAGAISSSLEGTGVARTRVGLKIKPRTGVAKAGRSARFKAVVKNRGGIAATGIKVCLTGPKKTVKGGKRCLTIGNLGTGSSRTLKFTARAPGSVRKVREFPLMFRLGAANAGSSRSSATLRAKPRR